MKGTLSLVCLAALLLCACDNGDNTPANRPPVLAAIGNKTVAEGDTLTFIVNAVDPDEGQVLTFSSGNLPTGASFNAATRTFSWTPTPEQVANYPNVLFKVTDNGVPPASDSETITITVGDVNRPPVLDPIGAKEVAEGALLTIVVTATDPDSGQTVTLSASNMPTGAAFDAATGTFTWTPTFDQAANYQVLFAATDDGVPDPAADSEEVTITVGGVNRLPVLDPIGSQTVDEGILLTIVVTGSDPDVGDTLTYSASNLPMGADFDPITRTFTWTPGFDQTGNYPVLFAVTDNGSPPASDSEEVTITVGNVNRPPVLDPIGAKSVDEGAELAFIVTGFDPDGDDLAFSTGPLPTGASFDPVTQAFSWIPEFDQSGNHVVTFAVTDDGTPAESDSEDVTITVGDVNRPPVLGLIGDRTVAEGVALTFTVTGSDPDGNGLSYSADPLTLPPGATFDQDTQTFTWTPVVGDSVGSPYTVLFTVTDDGIPPQSDSREITITVTP